MLPYCKGLLGVTMGDHVEFKGPPTIAWSVSRLVLFLGACLAFSGSHADAQTDLTSSSPTVAQPLLQKMRDDEVSKHLDHLLEAITKAINGGFATDRLELEEAVGIFAHKVDSKFANIQDSPIVESVSYRTESYPKFGIARLDIKPQKTACITQADIAPVFGTTARHTYPLDSLLGDRRVLNPQYVPTERTDTFVVRDEPRILFSISFEADGCAELLFLEHIWAK
jgi:hypothetical protein